MVLSLIVLIALLIVRSLQLNRARRQADQALALVKDYKTMCDTYALMHETAEGVMKSYRDRMVSLTTKNLELYAEENKQRARAVKAELELQEINDTEKREPIQ